MSHTDVVISGFGGQGVIMAGIVLGKTISIFSDGFATMTQNFGPEARGGACTAQVVVDSDNPIRYPYVQHPKILIAMSQEGYEKHEPNLASDGLLLYEEELVEPHPTRRDQINAFGIPAARIAEEFGNPMVLNMVMIGFLAGTSDLIEVEPAKKAIAGCVPSHFIDLNHKAFDKGYEYGCNKLEALKASGSEV